MLVWLAWTGPPTPAHKLALAGTPAQPHFDPLQEKISGMEARGTPDEIANQVMVLMQVWYLDGIQKLNIQ